MIGRADDAPALEALGAAHGLALELVDRFVLPRSGARRAVARYAAP